MTVYEPEVDIKERQQPYVPPPGPRPPIPAPPPSPVEVATELERMVDAVNAQRDENIAEIGEQREGRSRAARGFGPAVAPSPPPYVGSFYGQGGRPIPGRPEILATYPWSSYGRGIVGRTPFLTEGTPGAMAVPPASRVRPEVQGATHGVKLALPDLLRGLPWPESVYLKTGGAAVPHELSHVAQAATWGQADEEAFGAELLAWLAATPVEEWDDARRYVYEQYVRRGKSMIEAYAHLGERPELVPPELEHWYPQYDLTRRRAMGVSQPMGYAGPRYGGNIPRAPLLKEPQ